MDLIHDKRNNLNLYSSYSISDRKNKGSQERESTYDSLGFNDEHIIQIKVNLRTVHYI